MSNWIVFLYLIIICMCSIAAALYFQNKVKGQVGFSRSKLRYDVVYKSKNGKVQLLQRAFFYMRNGETVRFGFGNAQEWQNQVSFEDVFERITGIETPQQNEMKRYMENKSYNSMFELVDSDGMLIIRGAFDSSQCTKDIYYKKQGKNERLSDKGRNFDDVSQINGDTQIVEIVIPDYPIYINIIRYL